MAAMAIEGIVLSEADGQLYVRGQPHQDRPTVDDAALGALLDEHGYGDWQRDAEGFAQAIQDCNTRATPFAVLVAKRCDFTIDVEIAEDAMQATINLSPPMGGRKANIEDVIAALLEAGVSVGVDRETLLEACEAGSAEHLMAARGESAQEGSESDFVELLPATSDRAPRVDENGLIDYREHAGLTLVEPGTALLRRVPAVQGLPGRNVMGQLIAPRPVRDEPFAENLPGARVSEENPELLTAAIAGAPVRVQGGVMVEPVLRVREVNLSSGNIYFEGTVEVEGDVIQGMRVQASGDIFIGGTVEGGSLDAKGNVSIKGGIIAASRVHADGSISARFVEGSSLDAGTVISLDDAALDASLMARNQILIGSKNPQRGRLIGGLAKAKLLLQVPLLGSENSGVTKVELGYDPELEASFQKLEQRIAQEKLNEDNLQKVCKHLVSIKDPKGMLERAKAAWRQATQEWGKSLVERAELEKKRSAMLGAKLEIRNQTQGNIELTLGTKRSTLRKEYGRGFFGMDRAGVMVFTTPDGKSAPV
jgi:uncharacterized protein (DUF342 family)